MHRSTPSTSQSGLFKSPNIFGTTRRPSTSGGPKDNVSTVVIPVEPLPTLARKASFRGRFNSTSSTSPESRRPSVPHLEASVSAASQDSGSPRKSGESARKGRTTSIQHPTGRSRRDSYTSILPFSNMLARPGTSYSSFGTSGGGSGIAPAQLPSPTLENITYLHIQETSTKRISTLDYLRKAYVSSNYILNTCNFC